MKYLFEKLASINRYGLVIPGIALATVVYYQFAYFVFIYTNAQAHRIVPDFFDFTQMVFLPEPYETIGYFLGFLIIPFLGLLTASLFNFLVDKNYIRREFVQKWPIALVVCALAFLSYKIALHLLWFDVWHETEPPGDLKLQLMLLSSMGIGLLLYWRSFDISRLFAWAEKLPWGKIRPILFLFLALLLLSPNFPFDYHHYTDQIAPANDLLHSKQFLNRDGTYSHYGLLNTYFWYALFSFVPISYQAASLAVMLAAVAWFFAWYFIFRNWLKSEAIAALATLVMIVFFTVPKLECDSIYGAPSATPFHQLGFLVVALLWLRFALQSQSIRTVNLILMSTAVAAFWYVDTGLYVVASTLGVFAFWNFFSDGPLARRIKDFLWIAVKLVLMICGLVAAYSVWQFFRFGAWPDWPLLYFPALVYQSGYMMVPLPSYGFYLVFIFIFLVSFGYLLWKAYRESEKLPELVFPLFLTLFGVLQMLYYITRSHTTNLAPRVSFFLVAIIAWWWTLLKNDRETKRNIYVAFSSVLAGILIFVALAGAYKFRNAFSSRNYNIAGNYRSEFVGRADVYGGNADILEDIAILKSDYNSIERPAVFHLLS